LCHAFPDEIADHDHACGNAEARSKGNLWRGFVSADRIEDRKTGPDGSLRVILMRSGIAEIGEYAVTEVLSHKAVEPLDLARAAGLKGTDYITLLLGIKPS
jgi:hypothetical protein